MLRWPVFSPFLLDQPAINVVFQILAAAAAIYSAWLAVAAIRELGGQWSLEARVLDDHKLVTSGVYSLVRHPIYTAMLGMLISSGIVISHWLAVAVAVIAFLVGTSVRIHLEEKLLSDAFGNEFQEWKRRVPGLIPTLRSRGSV